MESPLAVVIRDSPNRAVLKRSSFTCSGPRVMDPQYTGSRIIYHSAKNTAEGCNSVDRRTECMDEARLRGGESRKRAIGIELGLRLIIERMAEVNATHVGLT
jgi:hypothetical protein